MHIVRRALARVIRWAMYPTHAPFATRGSNVLIVRPYEVNYPDRLFLGDDIYIGPYAAFNSVGGIRIGTGSVLGPFVHIYSGNHQYEGADALPFDERMILRPVDIEENVWIGGDVTILPGVRVGEGAVVGAGALVTKDVPAFTIVAGCPARVIKQRDIDRYNRLKQNGQLLNRLVGVGRNKPQLVGTVPSAWYKEAGLPVPDEFSLVSASK